MRDEGQTADEARIRTAAATREGIPQGLSRNRSVLLVALNLVIWEWCLAQGYTSEGGPYVWLMEVDDRVILRTVDGLWVTVPPEAQSVPGVMQLVTAWEKVRRR